MRRKLISTAIILAILIVSIPTMAVAVEEQTDNKLSAYQEVIDRLNAEFGTNARFPTQDDIDRMGNVSINLNLSVTVEEFEETLRSDIEADIRANNDALDAIARLYERGISEEGSGVVSSPSFEANTIRDQSRRIAGGTAHLRAEVTTASGFPQYVRLIGTNVTWISGRDSTPIFIAETFNFALIDANRTYAITYHGFTMSTDQVIINPNAMRYVEFHASSPS